MGIFSRISSAINSTNKFLYQDVPLGIAKGIGSTIESVGSMGANALDKTLGTLSGSTMFDANKKKLEPGASNVQNALKPNGFGQKLGFAGEQIGEFFVPGGVAGKTASFASKGLKTAEAANAVSKIATTAPKAMTFAERALALGKKVLPQALSDASTSLQQTGDAKEAAMTGGVSSILGVSAPLVKWMGKKISAQSSRVINSLVKPVSKEFEFGRNAGAGVVREKVTGATRESFYKNLFAKRQELGAKIGKELSNVNGVTVDASEAVTVFDDLIKKANKGGKKNAALVERLKNERDALTGIFSEATGERIGSRSLKLTPEKARELKTMIGDDMQWTGQAFDNQINQAKAAAYRKLNDLIEVAVPGIKKLNARYSDIFSAERAMKRTMDIVERQNLTSLPSTVLASQGLTGLAGAALRSTLGSTPVKTGIIAPGVNALGKMVQKVPALNPAVSGLVGKVGGAVVGTDTPQLQAPSVMNYPKSDALMNSQPDKYKQFIESVVANGGTEEQAKAFIETQNLP